MKTEPVWLDLSPPVIRPQQRPLESMRADVAIIGGGLAGLSAAYHLVTARPGMRVVLLEADQLGAGASGRNTGMLGPGVGQSLPALVSRLGRAPAAALYRQTLLAVDATRNLIEREGIACDLQMTGQLLRATGRGDRRRLARQAALMQELDLPVEVLDDERLSARLRLGRAPGDAHDGPAALRLPRAGLLNPAKLVAGLAARAAALGAALHGGARVMAVADVRGPGASRLGISLTGGREIVADRAIVATAGYTAGLDLLRARVLPVHLQALATEPLPARDLARLGWAGREGVIEARRIFNYFRLTTDDRLVFGGAAPRYHWQGRPSSQATARAHTRLRRELAAAFPPESGMAEVPVTHAWSGVIGYTTDALPVLGRDPARSALFYALGWCGHGLALSVASGAWMARLVLGEADVPVALRPRPPALPGEALRWLAFRTAVATMAFQDRVA